MPTKAVSLDGKFEAVPDAGQDHAIATRSLDVATYSLMELEVVVDSANTGGLVFDRYGDDEFKFAVIDTVADQIVIGHHTSHGWSIDATADFTADSGTAYTLGASLLGGQTRLRHHRTIRWRHAPEARRNCV